ncbi:40S ribosomal protein S29-like [Sturnira hondurensis]|uniref:40S ribosomal protein S29-like n=1 Tax=Sturnira hondurensis TaxID=192404 RepID=UPI001879F5D3|nr:40S ribosomal protein S29-like [Sturnira hondurensis]
MNHQQIYWSHPRKFCRDSHSCHICLNGHSLIWKYGLNRHCQGFCQYTKDTDFIRLD